MKNNKILDGFELLFRIDLGMNQYYEGYTLSLLFDSYVEIADTSLADIVLFETDVDKKTVQKIIDKLRNQDFYSKFVEELKSNELPSNPDNVKYSLSVGLGCRSEQHFLNEATTQSVIDLLQYLREEFSVGKFHKPYQKD